MRWERGNDQQYARVRRALSRRREGSFRQWRARTRAAVRRITEAPLATAQGGSGNRRPILVTGATSHTGRRLVQRLVDRNQPVRCLLHTPAHRGRLPQSHLVEIMTGSADSPRDLARAISGVDTVLHIAHIRFAETLVETLARERRRRRLVVISSTRLLSRFPTPVREVVRRGEAAVRAAPEHIEWTILRPSMIFGGPRDNNIERLAAVVRKHRLFPVFGGGRNRVQPTYVWDLIEAIASCLEHPRSIRNVITIAGPEAMTYREMVRQVARASGAPEPIFAPIPYRPGLWAARLLARLLPRPPINPEMIERFGEDRCFDVAPARELLDLKLTPFAKALEAKFSGRA